LPGARFLDWFFLTGLPELGFLPFFRRRAMDSCADSLGLKQ
jgi:hypothetical protein